MIESGVGPTMLAGSKCDVVIINISSMCTECSSNVRCVQWTYLMVADTDQIGIHKTYNGYETVQRSHTLTRVYTTDTHSLEYTHWYARIHG